MEPLKDRTRVDTIVARDGIKVPDDVVCGSYGWRSFLYANLFKDAKITVEDKEVLVDLWLSILDVHRAPWSRMEMIPLDESKFHPMRALVTETMLLTASADVLRACLWQAYQLKNGHFYTDDHVVSLIQGLAKCRRSQIT